MNENGTSQMQNNTRGEKGAEEKKNVEMSVW